MTTVRAWSALRGYDYQLIGDEFLLLAPAWYRQKATGFITIITDLSRLIASRQYLKDGFECAIWIDADVVIFNPALLQVDAAWPYSYCREVLLTRNLNGKMSADVRVNNAICVFRQDAISHLDEYIFACTSNVSRLSSLWDNAEVGTKLLTVAHRRQHFQILSAVGLLTPLVMDAILREDNETLTYFKVWHNGPIGAGNLCNSLRGGEKLGRIPDEKYSATVDKLLRDHGGILSV
jgi:hypothetical protein